MTAATNSVMVCDAPVTIDDLRRVAGHFYGDAGRWAYDAFEAINSEFYDNELDLPLIRFELIPYGHGIGDTSISPTFKPVIRLMPKLAGTTFCMPSTRVDVLSPTTRFMRDVLLHETIHVSVHQRLSGISGKGDTSHNNTKWVSEINRIAVILGFQGFRSDRKRSKRVPNAEGGGIIKAVPEGCVPYEEVCSFPHATWRRIDPSRYGGIEGDVCG